MKTVFMFLGFWASCHLYGNKRLNIFKQKKIDLNFFGDLHGAGFERVALSEPLGPFDAINFAG